MGESTEYRNLITGGAGFLGSHLVDKLMNAGEEVICLDNYITGRKENVSRWIGHPKFELIRHDVTQPIQLEIDKIWHLACCILFYSTITSFVSRKSYRCLSAKI